MRISRDCFANLVADFCTTFVRVSHECHENFHVSRTRSRDACASVAKLLQRNFGEFTLRNFRDTRRATVLRKHAKTSRLFGEKIKLSDIRTNVVRHSHGCRTSVIRIKMKISYIRGKVMRHSHECRTTVV